MAIHFLKKDERENAFRAIFKTDYNHEQTRDDFRDFLNLASGNMPLENLKILQDDFDKRYSQTALNEVAALQTRFNISFTEDVIKPLTKLTDLQLATPINRRYIMSHPELSSRYAINAINGYDGEFSSEEGSAFDYMDATNSVDVSVNGKVTSTTYLSNKGNFKLLPAQRKAILKTFSTIEKLLDSPTERADCTSIWNTMF